MCTLLVPLLVPWLLFVLPLLQVFYPHSMQPVQFRVGIHCGPVASGLVGPKMPKCVRPRGWDGGDIEGGPSDWFLSQLGRFCRHSGGDTQGTLPVQMTWSPPPQTLTKHH